MIEVVTEKIKKKYFEGLNEKSLQSIEADVEAIKNGEYISKIDKYFNDFYEEKGNFLEYLPKNCLLCIDENAKINQRIENIIIENNNLIKSLTERERFIPEGILNGEKIRLIGQGKKGKNGGKNGDLLIQIKIDNDRKFRLEGPDVHTDLLITPWEAALGTRVSIETLDEEVKVYIPQGIQSGEIVRIPNKGYRINKSTRGDLVAEIKIVVPKTLKEPEVKLFEKLKEVSKFNPRSDKK